MFGTNEIVGKKHFKDAPAKTLLVTSMFFTLQGEGPHAGKPAFFIRLTKCNLDCSFCDTFFDDGDLMSFHEIDKKIEETINDYFKGEVPEWAQFQEGYEAGPEEKIPDGREYVTVGGRGVAQPQTFVQNKKRKMVLVMTGGEPLLQENISEFMKEQLSKFEAVQVESNGIPDTLVPERVTLVCSPKCVEKNDVAVKYYSPSKTILDRADCLKFVMSSDLESPYSSIPEWAFEWKKQNPEKEIYISPMNIYNSFPQKIKLLRAEKGQITMQERSTVDEVISFWEPGLLNLEANQRNHEYTARYCVTHGFRLNLQMHLYASLA